MASGLALIAVLVAPAVILWLTRHVQLAAKFGAIVLCYALGLLIGLSGLWPEEAAPLRQSVTEASLALALPLLLFSVDMRAWRHVAGRAMLSMGLAVVAVVAVASALYHLFDARGVAAAEQLSGMAVGMYTGGLANLGAIKLALDIPDSRYLTFATVDTVIGALYLLFVLTVAPRLFARLLPPFPPGARTDATDAAPLEAYGALLRRASWPGALLALAASAACVGAAVLTAPLLPFGDPQIMVIVLLTSFGLGGSLLPALRRNRQAPALGMYLILVFSLCVAASMDLAALARVEPSVLLFVAAATFGSLALHAVLCRVVRVDVDTFLITSVAALMSPAFVPMVARSLRNPGLLMSGMATGILGFAIGNYLGIAVALLLRSGG